MCSQENFEKALKKAKRRVEREKKTKLKDDIDNVDLILDKLKQDGWDGLSENEKSILFQASKKRNKDHHIN